MLKASYKKYQLQFKFNALTSRGGMNVKNGYYLLISDEQYTGIGECSFIEGLSIDDLANYEATLQLLCEHITSGHAEPLPALDRFPSIKAGWEMAKKDLENGGVKILYPSAFTHGKAQIPINGLIWMGNRAFMLQQLTQKLEDGFKCIKLKVGAINFEEEVMLLDFIRQKFPPDVIEIRLDANGAFNPSDVFTKLDTLSKFGIHSIEQPVRQGQLELMAQVCNASPIPVALDEELIDLRDIKKDELIRFIKPDYLILKPTLLGGFESCNEWINLAAEKNVAWWATSALESNIGLNAIAQWIFTKSETVVQGLGTGGLYTNNVSSPLFISKGYLGYNPLMPWGGL